MELARNFKVDSVSGLNATAALCLWPGQTVAAAVALMRQQRVGCVLVRAPAAGGAGAPGKVIGLFTERDLLCRVLAVGLSLNTPIEQCMTHDPVVVEPGVPIATAVRYMLDGGYRHLPVVDESGYPVGVLSMKRVVHYLVEHFPSTIYCLPPDPTLYPRQREGA